MRGQVAAPSMSRVDARSLSSKLRRIIKDGDLRQVAGPRIEKLFIKAPKNIDSASYKSIQFFYAGYELGDRPTSIAVFDPDRVMNVPRLPDEMELMFPDQFLQQPICCFRDRWLTRRDLLVFVAHNAMGVHFDDGNDDTSRIIKKIRNMFILRTEQIEGFFTFNVEEPSEEFVYSPDTLDIASYECLGMAHYLTTSPSVIELEKVIRLSG